MEDKILEIRNISKSFPGVKALDDVSFDVYRGEVHALAGENGAGKSTLMKILNGNYKRDTGTICIDGKEVNVQTPNQAKAEGCLLYTSGRMPLAISCSTRCAGRASRSSCPGARNRQ